MRGVGIGLNKNISQRAYREGNREWTVRKEPEPWGKGPEPWGKGQEPWDDMLPAYFRYVSVQNMTEWRLTPHELVISFFAEQCCWHMCLPMQISFNGYSMLGVTAFFGGYWSTSTKILCPCANNSFMTFKPEAIMDIFWQTTCLKTSGGARANYSISRYPCICLSGSCCVMTDEPFKKWNGTIALYPPKKQSTLSQI